MKIVKATKLLRRDITILPSRGEETAEQDSILKIKYLMPDSDRKEMHFYLAIKPYQQEELQYQALVRDIEGDKDLKILFDKKILPIRIGPKSVFSPEEVRKLKEIHCQFLIFDISEFTPTSKDFLSKHTWDLYSLFTSLSSLKSIVIVTPIHDRDFYIFREDPYSTILIRLEKMGKKLIFASEEGYLYLKEKWHAVKAERFLHEHLAYIIRKQERKYYGHFEVGSGIHVRVFQDFYKLIPDYEEVFLNYLEDLLGTMKNSRYFDTLISFAFPQNPFREICGRLKESLEIAHIGVDKALGPTRALENRKIKEALLLTDIIYSGNTAREIINILKSKNIKIQGLVTLMADNEKYSHEIDGIPVKVIVHDDLPWWNIKVENCPLCRYKVPKIGRKEGIDRRTAIKPELNLFDFYDFIRKTNALDTKPRKTLNRNYYRFYFRTGRIFHKFGVHLARVLLQKIGSKIETIETIICPEDHDMSAALLSLLVSQEIGGAMGRTIPVVCIKRDHIEAWKDDRIRDLAVYKELHNTSAIIIDDGINTVTTIKNLRRICESSLVKVKDIIGSAAFLNRLSLESRKELELERDTWWLYHWPSSPFEVDEFPYVLEGDKRD